MGTQPGNNGTLSFYGGTEMTSQDELRDFDELRNRIAYILETHQHMAIDQQACAIVNDLGLTVETHAATHSERAMTRIISAWEWDNQ